MDITKVFSHTFLNNMWYEPACLTSAITFIHQVNKEILNTNLQIDYESIWCWSQTIPGELVQFYCCWYSSSLHHQVTTGHGKALRWRHNESDGISNHQPYHCLLNRLFGRRSKKTSKLRVTGLCAGNSPGTGEFPAQIASSAENVSISWRHHGRWS